MGCLQKIFQLLSEHVFDSIHLTVVIFSSSSTESDTLATPATSASRHPHVY